MKTTTKINVTVEKVEEKNPHATGRAIFYTSSPDSTERGQGFDVLTSMDNFCIKAGVKFDNLAMVGCIDRTTGVSSGTPCLGFKPGKKGNGKCVCAVCREDRLSRLIDHVNASR